MSLKRLTLYLLLLISTTVSGQEEAKIKFNSIVSLSALTPTFNYAPRWNIGYMRNVNKRYWIGLDLGYGDYNTTINFAKESGGSIRNDYTLFEIRPEVYYDLKLGSKLKHLASVEFFYINHKDKFTDGTFIDNDGSRYKYSSADYNRVKYGVNMNYNLIYYFSERFALLQKVGIGIKNRTVKYSNVKNKESDLYYSDTIDGYNFVSRDYLRNTGTDIRFNFNFDLKLIYKF